MDKNKRILIVDDDPGIRETYREILSPSLKPDIHSKGIALYEETVQEMKPISRIVYELTLAERGDEGIRAVEKAVEQQNPFAAAFIDMKMPGIDGAETAKQIWDIDPRMKILIVTAYSEYLPEDIIRVTGRDDIFFLRKPFSSEEITQFARVFVTHWNAKREKGIKREYSLPSETPDNAGGYTQPVKETEIPSNRTEPVETERDDQNDLYSAYRYDPEQGIEDASNYVAVVCPLCEYGIGLRVHRKIWMRMIPFSRHYQCNWCLKNFIKIRP